MDGRCRYERNSQQAQAVNQFARASRGCDMPTGTIDTQSKSTELNPSGGRPSQLNIPFCLENHVPGSLKGLSDVVTDGKGSAARLRSSR